MGSAQMNGVGGYIELGGRRLQLFPLRPVDFDEAKAFLRSSSENPFEAAKRMCEGLPENVVKEIMVRAYDEYLRWGSLYSEQGKRWASSEEGIAFFVWRSLREKQPDLANEEGRLWVFTQLQDIAAKELSRIMDELQETSGLDERNPTSPTESRRHRKPSKKGKHKQQKNGTSSTGRSPSGTRGPIPTLLQDSPSTKLESSLETMTIGSSEKGKSKTKGGT